MHDLARVAPAFVEMAHGIVWATIASVDTRGRPRSRIMHPVWTWDGQALIGWIGTRPTPLKRSTYMSCNYWAPTHDTCVAECQAELLVDDQTRAHAWNVLENAPPPAGYDPSIVPDWPTPTAPAFAVLRLTPWRLRVFPGTVLLGQGGEVLVWQSGNRSSTR